MRRDGNPSFTLFINHRLQPSYHVTLSPLIVLSVVYRETLLGRTGPIGGCGLLPEPRLIAINFWVLSGAQGVRIQSSQVFCPTRQKMFPPRNTKAHGRSENPARLQPSRIGFGRPCSKVLCSQNFSHSTFPYRFLRSEKRPNCLCFKATVVPPNSLYK